MSKLQIPPPFRPLFEAAAKRHHISLKDLLGRSYVSECVAARREIAWALRGRGLSLVRIGRLLGGRSHATVLNYLKREPPKATKAPSLDEIGVDESGIWAI